MKQQDIYASQLFRLFFFATRHPVFPSGLFNHQRQTHSLFFQHLGLSIVQRPLKKISVALIKKVYAEDSEGRNRRRGEKMKDYEVEVSLDVWWMGEIMLGSFHHQLNQNWFVFNINSDFNMKILGFFYIKFSHYDRIEHFSFIISWLLLIMFL